MQLASTLANSHKGNLSKQLENSFQGHLRFSKGRTQLFHGVFLSFGVFFLEGGGQLTQLARSCIYPKDRAMKGPEWSQAYLDIFL